MSNRLTIAARQLMDTLAPRGGEGQLRARSEQSAQDKRCAQDQGTASDTLVSTSETASGVGSSPRSPGRPPTASALAAPGDASRCKEGDLSPHQRDVFYANLRKSYHPRARALYDAIVAGETDFKAPHVLRHTDADGVERTYVVSRTLARGAYGKFRHALELGPEMHHYAVKEFRDGARFWYDIDKARARLESFDLSDHEAQRATFNGKALLEFYEAGLITLEQAALVEANSDYAAVLVHEGVLTPGQGRRIMLNEAYLKRLVVNERLTPAEKNEVVLTRFVTPEDVANEYQLAARVNSPLAAIDNISVDGRIFIITKVMDGELTLVKDLDPKQAGGTVRHMLTAVGTHMAWAHGMGIMHRDLKPANILFDLAARDMYPGDYGLAVELEDGRSSSYGGTVGFMAPEIVAQQSYGHAADVYSLGMTAATLALGRIFLPGHGAELKQATRIFAAVHDALPRDATGMCNLSCVGPAENCLQPERAIRERLQAWYRSDPELATYVVSKMLATDPEQRDTMGQVATRFALRPDAVGALAKVLDDDVVGGELAVMEAFAMAYLEAPPVRPGEALTDSSVSNMS